MSKPRVKTRCVANGYAADNERIVEFGVGRDGTGGLIALRHLPDGTLLVDLYRMTGKIDVRVSPVEAPQ